MLTGASLLRSHGDIALILVASGALVEGVGASLLLVSMGPGATANDEKATAFETYEPALRKQLNLCRSGSGVVPCEGPPAPTPSLVLNVDF